MSQDQDPTLRAARARSTDPDPGALTQVGSSTPLPAGAPRRLGRHEVVGRLGAGGMGEVFAVRDPLLEREVAVKVVRGGLDGWARDKFVREALITGQLEHPSIVPLYDMGEGATPYFVMRKVAGTDLEALLGRADGALTLAELLAIFVKVCEAVAFAHAKGIIHRDLKPANIMTGAFGEVYVMDWGLAKRLSEAESARAHSATATPEGATLDGTVMGTPQYMPPEQAEGEIARLDARSDVYSLGAILYHLLAGVPPYGGRTSLAVLEEVSAGPPAPPSARVQGGREIPWELEAVCLKAMAREQDARYPSALALKQDVESFLVGRFVGAARYGPWAAMRKWAAGNRALVRGAAAVVIAACVVAGVLDHRARAVAQEARARHAERVAAAQDRLRGGDIASLVARAKAVPLMDDPARRALPAAAELARQSQVMDALGKVSLALGDLLALEPGDVRVRTAQYAVLTSIAHLAQVRHDDGMAALAYAQAARLGVDDAGAIVLAQRAADAPGLRLAARAARIEAILADAEEGRLDSDVAYQGALVELASYRERGTVERLVQCVEHAVLRLRGAAREAFAVALPDEMGTLGPLLEAWMDPSAKPMERADLVRIATATGRLIRHEPRRLGDPTERRAGDRILAIAQADAMAEAGRYRAVAARIACDALGLIGDPEGVADPLERLTWAWCDERDAIPAGIALARLAGGSESARRALLGMVGLVGDGASKRVELAGPFWLSVSKVLANAGIVTSAAADGAEPGDSHAWARRGLARFYQGDLDGALSDYARAITLDPSSPHAYVNRAVLRIRSGAAALALADLDLALAVAPGLAEVHAHRGMALSLLGRYEDAFVALERALALDPGNGPALTARSYAYLAVGDRTRAAADSERAVELDPRSLVALIVRARVRAESGDPAGAMGDLTRALELDPRFADALLARADLHFDQGDLARAWTDVEHSLAIAPASAAGLYLRSLIRRERRELALALADVDRSIALDPDNARAHALRAYVYCDMGESERGLTAFAGVIARWPTDGRAYLDRGNVLLGLGRIAEACADYDRAIARDPDSGPAHGGRSAARRLLGDTDGALADAERALELVPGDARMHSNRGVVYADRLDWTRALADFDRALELDPAAPKIHCLRGAARRSAGDSDGALADYDRALALDPAESTAHEGRGKVLQAQGRLDDAILAYSRAIDMDANRPSVHAQRGQLRHQRGDTAGARADYDRALELDPTTGWVWSSRGVLRQDAGDFAGAISDYERYVALRPDDPLGHANLGAARWDANDLEGAIGEFDRALALDPNHVLSLLNRGDVRALLGQAASARADFERALELPSPKWWRAHLGLARLHVAQGERAQAEAAVARAIEAAPPERKASVEREGKKILGR